MRAHAEEDLNAPPSRSPGPLSDEPLAVLVVGAGHAMSALIKPVFDAGPLRPRHVLLLSVLTQQPFVTQQQLVEALRLDPSVLVGLLNELETIGVVARTRDPADRRRHLVKITSHGHNVYTQVLADIDAAAQPATAALTTPGRRDLNRALTSIIELSLAATTDAPDCEDRIKEPGGRNIVRPAGR